ncbi:MAG: PF20097 family protein [Corallococcus sp.]|nr:PF20097 family protein [Corallococcus sp.]
MKCPFCNAEMEQGKSIFNASRAAYITLTYTSDKEAQKGFFKRETIRKVISDCEEAQTFYCSECKKIIPILEDK